MKSAVTLRVDPGGKRTEGADPYDKPVVTSQGGRGKLWDGQITNGSGGHAGDTIRDYGPVTKPNARGH